MILIAFIWLLALPGTIAVDSLRGRSKKSTGMTRAGLEASIRIKQQKLQSMLQYTRKLDDQYQAAQSREHFALDTLQAAYALFVRARSLVSR